jgi:hypothetical protein
VKINLVKNCSKQYEGIVDAHLGAVAKWLTDYQVTDKSQHGMVNLHLFSEDWYRESVGKRGFNVFMSHGVADKNYTPVDDWYDAVLVSGPLRETLLRGKGYRGHIRIVGDVRLDGLNPYRSDTVLWAPTHGGTPEHSTLRARDLIESVGNLTTALHPNERDAKPTCEPLESAGVVIADSGSTLYEAWALGKPVVLLHWLIGPHLWPGTMEHMVYEQKVGYMVHGPDPRLLRSAVNRAMQQGISRREREFSEQIIPTSTVGHAGSIVAEVLQSWT